ncbi:MAG: glycosyltransferase [Thermodesulfobacteriota bacterium]
MKIVQVIHGFPPYNTAGSEVYTYNLSRELAKKDEVYVFYRIADPEREEYEMSLGTYDGLNVCTVNNTFKYCDSFEKTYRNDIISKKFGSFLDEVKPDIAHFGHVTCLSTTLIEEAKKRKIPVVFTLHDFWLFCQLGQLLKRDLSLCHGPIDSECARCLAPQLAIKGGVRKAFELLKRTVPNFQNRTRPSSWLRTGLEKILRKIYRQYTKAFFLFQKDAKAQIQKRTTHIKEMCSLVDLFIAPSTFLLGKFIEFGIPGYKIIYYDYGFNMSLLHNFSKVYSQKIRFGYIGTFIPSKGVHVLLEAFNSIKSQNTELRIHGKFLPYHLGFEDYPDYLRSLGKRDNILWFGEYDNKDIAGILSEIDILVVPSIWHENSPLTIHEAFMAQIPVITSNIGGMAELVQNRVNGLLFQVGDSKDLAKKMQMVIDDPGLIERLRKNINPVIPIENHALAIREIYRSLVSGKK